MDLWTIKRNDGMYLKTEGLVTKEDEWTNSLNEAILYEDNQKRQKILLKDERFVRVKIIKIEEE